MDFQASPSLCKLLWVLQIRQFSPVLLCQGWLVLSSKLHHHHVDAFASGRQLQALWVVFVSSLSLFYPSSSSRLVLGELVSGLRPPVS